MTGEPGAPSPLDADAAAVLHVLSRGYRKLTAHDVAHAHSFRVVTPDRVQTALDRLEDAGFVQRYTQPSTAETTSPLPRYGMTTLGRSVATGLT